MEWKGDEEKLQQLCQLFHLASSPDNNVQQQVMQTLNQFSSLPDFNLYLVTVFAKMTNQPEIVRQRAGLLLKTNLSRGASVEQQVAAYIQANTLISVRDPSKVIRHTAGTVITTIVSKVGVVGCVQTLDNLAQLIGDSSAEVAEGSFNALNKICEDGVTMLKHMWESPPHETQPFVSWCTERLLPRVLEYAKPSAPLHSRQNAIECLNHFALNYMFSAPRYHEFLPFAQKYVEVLGVMSQDPDTTVLKDVCKGFVCIIENDWQCKTQQMCEVVLTYMLKASRHPEYVVRLEALEIWTACTYSQMMLDLVQQMLPELVPVLLGNMVYSQADYNGMETNMIDDIDESSVPDNSKDIKPRCHKEKEDEDDDADDKQSGGAWGDEWTARKAAASSLDRLSNAFRVEIPPIVLPLIQQKLEDPSWEVQESGVLALGAIAFGCMDYLVQFLPQVMQLLLKLCEAPKPLLRSISCWCASRFSQWICHEKNPQQEQVLKAVLSALLQRTLDKNKRVQEAACSAFAVLEEEARVLLVPYLDDIVSTLVRAFQYYQAKNLLILYDATGTLAEAVGQDLNKPQYVQALLTPLADKFDKVADNDRSIIALFECLSILARSLGQSFLPLAPRLVERCMRLILEQGRAAQMWLQNPNEFEKPDREVMAASIDLLAGIIEGEQAAEVLARQNFMIVIPEVLKDTALQVKQSAFALVGDCAKNNIQYLTPFLPDILPLCAKSLRDNTSATVSNNSSWAIGEICVKVGAEYMAPYMDDIIQSLISVLQRQQGGGHQLLKQNVCITLGRLGMVSPQHMGKQLPAFVSMWCLAMAPARLDLEKVNAFQGMCQMIKANPQAALACIPALCIAISSFCPNPPPQLEPQFREILSSYKQTLGPNWAAVYGQLPQDTQMMLHHMYGLTA